MTANAIHTIGHSNVFPEILVMLLAKHESWRYPIGGFQLVGIVFSYGRLLTFNLSRVIFQTVNDLGR